MRPIPWRVDCREYGASRRKCDGILEPGVCFITELRPLGEGRQDTESEGEYRWVAGPDWRRSGPADTSNFNVASKVRSPNSVEDPGSVPKHSISAPIVAASVEHLRGLPRPQLHMIFWIKAGGHMRVSSRRSSHAEFAGTIEASKCIVARQRSFTWHRCHASSRGRDQIAAQAQAAKSMIRPAKYEQDACQRV